MKKLQINFSVFSIIVGMLLAMASVGNVFFVNYFAGVDWQLSVKELVSNETNGLMFFYFFTLLIVQAFLLENIFFGKHIKCWLGVWPIMCGCLGLSIIAYL